MNFCRPFILRPIATSLLMLAILLVGVLAYRLLPVSALPQVDYPTIQIITLYPGASPDVVASSITSPMERQFGQIPGLSQMASTSSGGASLITLQFNLNMPLPQAEQEVQAAINASANFLPNDLPAPPIYNKVNPADTPVLTLAVTSDTLPLSQIQPLIDTRLIQKLSQLPGVGLVSLSGGQRPAVRIQADPDALAARGLTLEAVRSAIASANVNQAKGSFDGAAQSSNIDANDQLRSATEYRQVIIAYQNGAPVRLEDVASVVDGVENSQLAAWANRKPALLINVQRQPGANVLAVIDRIQTALPELRSNLPQALQLQVLSNRSVTIRASVHDVQFELMLAIALVVMVIFLFLRNAAATLIPSVAVPLSLVGTFAVMYAAGFSINNLTLMALTIATGFVVDDAIVMIENIARYIESGETPLSAALKGSRQIAFTVISLTFSLIAVLIPLLFMGDVVGRLFREFAITLAVAILISALVSLTLTPMLCARWLKHAPVAPGKEKSNWFTRLIERYGNALTWVLRHQTLTLMIALFTLISTVALYLWLPKGFFPQQDTGLLQGISEAPGDVSFAAMGQRQQALVATILRDPAVANVSSFIGVDGQNPTLNTGRLLIDLKPREVRSESAQLVMQRLQRAVESVPNIQLYLQPVQDLGIGERVSRTQYQFTLSAVDPALLQTWAPRIVARLQKVAGLTEVNSDAQSLGRQAFVHIDRDAAGRLGVSATAIDDALYNAFGQRLISTIFTQSSQYRVVLEVKPPFKTEPTSVGRLHVASSSGTAQPLSALTTVETRQAPLSINRIGQLPAVTLSFNLAPGVALGEAVERIRTELAALQLPPAIDVQFQGAALAFEASLTHQLLLVAAAIITMYIVLGVLYESYIHPITILSTLPSATLGALLALALAGSEINLIAVIGIILLIGIVKKNAIMMIDFALDAERNQGMAPQAAIHQACLLRFRPILMTTMAALLGALPLMLSSGVGAELRRPLGLTLVGGLMVSQLLTLFTTPVIYLRFDRLARRARAWRERRRTVVSPDPAS